MDVDKNRILKPCLRLWADMLKIMAANMFKMTHYYGFHCFSWPALLLLSLIAFMGKAESG